MARTALLSLLPAALIASGWRALEEPVAGGELVLAAALAVGLALVPRGRLRLAAIAVGGLLLACAAFNLSPLDARPFDGDHDLVGPLVSRFLNGIGDYYEVAVPFDPGEHERMHGVLVLAVFAFSLLAALAVAARRPVLAAGATFAGAAWPVTLAPDAATGARGALMLAAALILLAALGHGAARGLGQGAVLGASVLVAALVVVSSPSVAKGGFLDWQNWRLYERDDPAVSVEYAWDSDYDGIDFPKQATTVLRVRAPRRAPYWRATTLDSVTWDGRWVEEWTPANPVPVGRRDTLVNDELLPARARDPDNWMRQIVTIEALQDSHLPAASVPVAYERGLAGFYGSGIASVGRLEHGQQYRVWSYAAQPTPRELARSRANYPSFLELNTPFLTIGRWAAVPPFGTPGRDATVREQIDSAGLDEYRPLYQQALRVVGRPRNPYAAVVALEAWFRSSGEFEYDEHPPASFGRPALVDFVTRHRRGYCQHYAGAMALMLRYLGIPARVAAGFTSGQYDETEDEFVVADINAHTWVEVWFAGYGWLPFDPTPGRGRLRASYSASSLFFDTNGAQAAFVGAAAALGLTVLREQLGGGSGSPDDRDGPRGLDSGFGSDLGAGAAAAGDTGGDNGRGRLALLLVAGLAGVLGLLWLAKWARRRLRYLGGEPRRVATAVRAELVDFLLDQRVRVAPSATPAEVSEAMRRSVGVNGDRLAEALGTARFGPDTAATEALTDARRHLRAVRRALRRRLGPRRRLRGLVSLRSFGFRNA